MSNEEKILTALEKLQADVDAIKAEVDQRNKTNKAREEIERRRTSNIQRAILETMANLLTDEEKDALGRYQEAEEARKAALYG